MIGQKQFRGRGGVSERPNGNRRATTGSRKNATDSSCDRNRKEHDTDLNFFVVDI